MWMRNFQGFFQEADDFVAGGGSGVEVFDDGDNGSVEGDGGVPTVEGAQDPSGGAQGDFEGDGGQQVAQQAQPGFTAEQVTQMMAAMPQAQQQPVQQQQPLTQEQIDEQLRVYRANEQLVEQLFGEGATVDGRVAAFQSMVDGIVQHLSTVMGYSNQMTMQDLEQRFAPLEQMREAQREIGFNNDLVEAYPALKGKEQAVAMVVDNLRANGYQNDDYDAVLRTVASGVEQVLRQGNAQFSLQQAQQQQSPQKPKMAGGLNGGGSGGQAPAQASNGVSENMKAVNALFD